MAQRYFDQGLRLDLRLQSRRGGARLQGGAAARSRLRDVLLGRGVRARPQHQRADGRRGRELPRWSRSPTRRRAPAKASPMEQALIAALGQALRRRRAERAELNAAYADAMAAVHAQFPDDQEVAVLFADCGHEHLALGLLGGRRPHREGPGRRGDRRDRAGAGGQSRSSGRDPPLHPPDRGLGHARARRALRRPSGRADAGRRPHRPHALAHLLPDRPLSRFARRQRRRGQGRRGLPRARRKDAGYYAYGYYPHNIHFVLVSAQMAGDAEHMLWAAERLDGKISGRGGGQRSAGSRRSCRRPTSRMRSSASRTRSSRLEDPGDTFPFVKATWHYARGVAEAAKGDFEAARSEAARIAEINQTADFSMLLDWYVPAPDVLQLARHVLEGRIAAGRGRSRGRDPGVRGRGADPGLAALHGAGLLVLPGAPVARRRQLMAGRAEEAAETFQAALIDAPNNGWALWGLMEAQQARATRPPPSRPRSCSTRPGRATTACSISPGSEFRKSLHADGPAWRGRPSSEVRLAWAQRAAATTLSLRRSTGRLRGPGADLTSQALTKHASAVKEGHRCKPRTDCSTIWPGWPTARSTRSPACVRRSRAGSASGSSGCSPTWTWCRARSSRRSRRWRRRRAASRRIWRRGWPSSSAGSTSWRATPGRGRPGRGPPERRAPRREPPAKAKPAATRRRATKTGPAGAKPAGE